MYTLQFDGMLRTSGNEWPTQQGLLGYGWLIHWGETEIARGYGVFLRACKAGSNAAEYLALIDGLEALADLRITNELVDIRGDAKCVIDQMTGLSSVSSPLTRQLHHRARKLCRRFSNLTWTWVPRRENRQADSLSRRSFRYLRYAPRPDQEKNQVELPHSYNGRLIPLVDLRVHSPVNYTSHALTNC
jgi:ribonuclease HI